MSAVARWLAVAVAMAIGGGGGGGGGGIARAEPNATPQGEQPGIRTDADAHRHADLDLISIEPLSLVARGISVSYERTLRDRASLAGIAAYRSAAAGDYDSDTFTGGAELRIWLRDHVAMRGPYVGLRLSVGHTRLTSPQMGLVGSATSLGQRIDVGWRFVIKNHVTIAPLIGIAIHEDFASSGRLSPIGHGAVGIGLEVGWLRQR